MCLATRMEPQPRCERSLETGPVRAAPRPPTSPLVPPTGAQPAHPPNRGAVPPRGTCGPQYYFRLPHGQADCQPGSVWAAFQWL